MNLGLLNVDFKDNVDDNAEGSEAENNVPQFNGDDLVETKSGKH